MSVTFSIDAQQYSAALAAVKSARTNQQKKKSLEGLAKLLFEGIPFLSFRYSNLRTASAEIDLVFVYKGFNETTVFDELGRYFLVECKNWKDAVGVKYVRDFIQKMSNSRVKLGVIVAPKGVTGADEGADALRQIHAIYDKEGLFVVVIAEEHLEEVRKGANFYELLEYEIESIRFDFISRI
ncbi:MAG: restriction endonuclease [Desulfomonilaceae bacterium]